MTCPRCNADSEHIAEHSDVCECGACGYQWSPRPMTDREVLDACGWVGARDAFNHDTGERCEPSYPRWTPGRAKPWE